MVFERKEIFGVLSNMFYNVSLCNSKNMSIEGFCRGNNSQCITLEERYCSVKGSYFEYDGKVQSQIMYLHTCICVGGPEKKSLVMYGPVWSRQVR